MKYIDAEKLIAEIEKRAKFHDDAMKACVGLNNIAITHSAGWKEDTELLAIITSLQQEQPEVDYNKFEKLFDDFCERNKGHHITSHDACMWFWELGLNAGKVW